jgi:hypothetical protein
MPPIAVTRKAMVSGASVIGASKFSYELLGCELSGYEHAADVRDSHANRTCGGHAKIDAFDAVDGAHSAASKCHRVVALKQTTLRGAVHGRS